MLLIGRIFINVYKNSKKIKKRVMNEGVLVLVKISEYNKMNTHEMINILIFFIPTGFSELSNFFHVVVAVALLISLKLDESKTNAE